MIFVKQENNQSLWFTACLYFYCNVTLWFGCQVKRQSALLNFYLSLAGRSAFYPLQISILPIAYQHFTHCQSANLHFTHCQSASYLFCKSAFCPNVVNQKLSILPIANQYFTLHQSADQHFTHTLKQMSCQGFRVFDH